MGNKPTCGATTYLPPQEDTNGKQTRWDFFANTRSTGFPQWVEELWKAMLEWEKAKGTSGSKENPMFIIGVRDLIRDWTAKYQKYPQQYKKEMDQFYNMFIREDENNHKLLTVNIGGGGNKFIKTARGRLDTLFKNGWKENDKLLSPKQILDPDSESLSAFKKVIEVIKTDKNVPEWTGTFMKQKWYKTWAKNCYVAYQQFRQTQNNAHLEYANEISYGYGYNNPLFSGEVPHGSYFDNDRFLDVDHKAAYHGHTNNDDLAVIGVGIIFGLILMGTICCICLIISFLFGGIVYKWLNKSSSKEQETERYQYVNNDDDTEHM